MLLALDPSSTCVGYALLEEDASILEYGRLLPGRDGAMDRLDTLIRELTALFDEHRPRHIVIEVTSGKVGKRHKGSGAGLGVYGMAVGAVWQACRTLVGPQNVTAVTENEWTNGTPKGRRLSLLRARMPAFYFPEKDPGGDAGDAIMLGEWTIARRRFAASALSAVKEKP